VAPGARALSKTEELQNFYIFELSFCGEIKKALCGIGVGIHHRNTLGHG
jgi:hypothetical protein